jgi:hypothetical protein
MLVVSVLGRVVVKLSPSLCKKGDHVISLRFVGGILSVNIKTIETKVRKDLDRTSRKGFLTLRC